MSEATNMEDRMLNIAFVQSDFFLNRIHEFEEKYRMQWGEFLAQYTMGTLDGCKNADYAEWAFLCNSFMSELVSSDETSPPGIESNSEPQKPERDSGFFILWGEIVRRSNLLRASRKSVTN